MLKKILQQYSTFYIITYKIYITNQILLSLKKKEIEYCAIFPCKYGVSQGTILGQLLFDLFPIDYYYLFTLLLNILLQINIINYTNLS